MLGTQFLVRIYHSTVNWIDCISNVSGMNMRNLSLYNRTFFIGNAYRWSKSHQVILFREKFFYKWNLLKINIKKNSIFFCLTLI